MKRIITLLSFLFYITYSFCQTYIYFGTACNYSKFKTLYDDFDFESKFSCSFGLGIKTNIFDNFDFSAELAYNNYSAFVEGYEGSPSHSYHYIYDLKLGYLSLSLLPGYSIGNKKLIFLNTGPYISILAFSRKNGTVEGYYEIPWHFDGRTVYINDQLTGNANDFYKILDFGLLASLGIRLKLSENLFLLPQFRYASGLLDIDKGQVGVPIHIRSAFLLIAIDCKL